MLHLECQFGLRGVMLQWFSSDLTSRSYHGLFGEGTLSTVYIICSVSQSSVLGPRLFILHTADLADAVAEHGVNFHIFADDTQLYLHCHHDDLASAACRLERCICDVSNWMSANHLMLNTEKMELLWAGFCYGPTSLEVLRHLYDSEPRSSTTVTKSASSVQ